MEHGRMPWHPSCARREQVDKVDFVQGSLLLASCIHQNVHILQGERNAKPDYGAVREAISDLLEAENYDDGGADSCSHCSVPLLCCHQAFLL